MKTIIAATDFSPVSLNAVYYAADLCKLTGNELAIFHAVAIPVSYSEWPEPASHMDALLSDANDQLNRLQEKIVLMMGDQFAVTTKIGAGDVLVLLKEYCSAINPYAVVMGAENTNALERFLFGAKTINAMRSLSWPLIVVPPGVKFNNISTIALASDFLDVLQTVPFAEIKTLVKAFNASLHVLHVSSDGDQTFHPDELYQSDLLLQLLRDVKPQFHHFHDSNLEKAIIDFSKSNNVDLLIVIPKKHDVIDRMFHHSFSKQLVLQAHIPVMAIRE